MGGLEGCLLFLTIIVFIVAVGSSLTSSDNGFIGFMWTVTIILFLCFFSLFSSKKWCNNVENPAIIQNIVIKEGATGLTLSDYFTNQNGTVTYFSWSSDAKSLPVQSTYTASQVIVKELSDENQKPHVEIKQKISKYSAKLFWIIPIDEEFPISTSITVFVPEGTPD